MKSSQKLSKDQAKHPGSEEQKEQFRVDTTAPLKGGGLLNKNRNLNLDTNGDFKVDNGRLSLSDLIKNKLYNPLTSDDAKDKTSDKDGVLSGKTWFSAFSKHIADWWSELSISISKITGLEDTLGNKVDKDPGKGLSTNDFDDSAKQKLKVIEAGAEKNKVRSVNGKTGEVDISINDIPNLSTQLQNKAEGLFADHSASKIYLLDKDGNEIASLDVGFLNNEGTVIKFNETDQKIELWNDQDELLSAFEVSDLLTNTADNIKLIGSKLQLRDVQNVVISEATLTISNIQGLQEALDLKASKAWVEDKGYMTTDTTYSEITESEAKSKTSSTKRLISGRRLFSTFSKHIADWWNELSISISKVSGLENTLETKADVTKVMAIGDRGTTTSDIQNPDTEVKGKTTAVYLNSNTGKTPEGKSIHIINISRGNNINVQLGIEHSMGSNLFLRRNGEPWRKLAVEDWVEGKGYLTSHQDISDFVKISETHLTDMSTYSSHVIENVEDYGDIPTGFSRMINSLNSVGLPPDANYPYMIKLVKRNNNDEGLYLLSNFSKTSVDKKLWFGLGGAGEAPLWTEISNKDWVLQKIAESVSGDLSISTSDTVITFKQKGTKIGQIDLKDFLPDYTEGDGIIKTGSEFSFDKSFGDNRYFGIGGKGGRTADIQNPDTEVNGKTTAVYLNSNTGKTPEGVSVHIINIARNNSSIQAQLAIEHANDGNMYFRKINGDWNKVARTDGSYKNLRAIATTKEDVGLSKLTNDKQLKDEDKDNTGNKANSIVQRDGTKINTAGGFFQDSDRRIKKNIKLLNLDIKKIINLPLVEFDRKSDSSHAIGVIAQDVEEIAPELVNKTKKGIRSVNYAGLSVLALSALKDINTRLEVLEHKILSNE